MNPIYITVIVPLYNKEKQIANTLKTVLSQTFQNFEIVIVDDGSTDNSVGEVEKIEDSRIRLIQQMNAGVSAARNRGIQEAKSECVAFLDADDEWDIKFLETIWELRNKFPQCKVWATSYLNCCGGNKTPITLRKIPFKENTGVLTNYFEVATYSHPPICSICVAVDKKLIQEIGGFPLGIKSGEDLLTWARLAVKTNIAYSCTALAVYNMGDGYILSNLPPRRQDEGDPVGRELVKLLGQYHNKSSLKRYISHWHKMRASVAIRYGERWETIKESSCAIRYNPMNFNAILFIFLAVLPANIRKSIISRV